VIGIDAFTVALDSKCKNRDRTTGVGISSANIHQELLAGGKLSLALELFGDQGNEPIAH
jgi:hypothetical protein